MMPQVILHVRMVFLAYFLTQLLMPDKDISMEQKQKHLRSLHCLYRPNEAPELVSMKDDGTLLPVTPEELVEPVRTSISGIRNVRIPNIDEFIGVTKLQA